MRGRLREEQGGKSLPSKIIPAHLCRNSQESARETASTSDDELKGLWKAFESTGVVGDLFRLQLLTAARPGEVSGMEWGELDLSRAIWTQPGARTKNRKVHVVPLCPTAVRILEGLQQHQEDAAWSNLQSAR